MIRVESPCCCDEGPMQAFFFERPNMFASSHLINPSSMQHWSNRTLHAIRVPFFSGNVMTVMGCIPLDELLVAISINWPVDASSSLTSSSWIHTVGEHLHLLSCCSTLGLFAQHIAPSGCCLAA